MKPATVLLLLIIAIVVVDSAELLGGGGISDIVPNSYIVVLKDGRTRVQLLEYIAALQGLIVGYNVGGSIGSVFKTILGFECTLPSALLNIVLNHGVVKYVEVNHILRISATTSQPVTNGNWGLDRIDQRGNTLDNSYTYNSTAGEGTTVYIIDTGVNSLHEEFEGRAIDGFSAFPAQTDDNGHGSHVAGIVAGKTYGVAKKAKIIGVKVLGADGSGSVSNIILGIDYVTNNASKSANKSIANMSLGSLIHSQVLNDAVSNSIASGIVYAIAAGNDGLPAIGSPATVTTGITVGATTDETVIASYSNTGHFVHIYAPGSDIKSAWWDSPTATNTISGTSMATPFVAGVLAIRLGTHPTTPALSKAWLLSQSTPVSTPLIPILPFLPILTIDFKLLYSPYA